MRNYIKMRAIEWKADMVNFFPPQHLTVHAIAITDKVLMSRVQDTNARIIAVNNPLNIWIFTYPNKPVNLYMKFNQKLLDQLLASNPDFWWNNLVSPDGDPANASLPNQAQVNDSPRSTFPTDKGTDGQRLRSGQTKRVGDALNYIGKLFFLTSNQAFKDLWDQLKAGTITAKDALALANLLVEAP
jgi:hypothetical protein